MQPWIQETAGIPSSARWKRGHENTRVSAEHITRHLVGIQKTPALKQLVLGLSNVSIKGSRHESKEGQGEMQQSDLDLESQSCLGKQVELRAWGEVRKGQILALDG